ncbi:PIN domain-containing protein [Microcoleus sp. FACHB-831]|uniref:PIN domain-containing protein n=1 Tax=Microcoleus sp. FACHB-831 TaxID=2692827 RepID=UPI00168999FB|nr:PIN domain-containing protein [Microcoleus sp. FACHB-831]MBD1920857.1 PIN domain-containing protein [Microcoleus sp. FACHB-831]
MSIARFCLLGNSPIDQDIALQAGKIRARHNLALPDAFQIVVALAAECEAFLANDAILRRVTEVQIMVVDDLGAI